MVYIGIIKGPRDKEVSVGFKNVIVLENGDIVVVVPPLHLTYHKAWKGGSFLEKVDVPNSTVFIPNAKYTEPIFPINKVHEVSFHGCDKSIWPFLPGFKNLKTYVTYNLDKAILEARELYDKQLRRSDMFRAFVMYEEEKWAAIIEHDIGDARHPHFMSPHISHSQT